MNRNFRQYETVSNFVANINGGEPNIIRCSESFIPDIVMYINVIRKSIDPPPKRYFIAQIDEQKICEFVAGKHGTDNFNFTFLYKNGNTFSGRTYDQNTDFGENFDFLNQGRSVNLDQIKINFSRFATTRKNTFWTRNDAFCDYKSKAIEPFNLNSVTPTFEESDIDGSKQISMTCVSVSPQDFFLSVTSKQKTSVRIKSVIMDSKMEFVIFENSHGAFNPTIADDGTISYPNPNSVSPFWGLVKQKLEKNYSMFNVTYDEKLYIVNKNLVGTESVGTYGYIIAFCVDEMLEILFKDTSSIIVATIGAIMVIVLILIGVIKYNASLGKNISKKNIIISSPQHLISNIQPPLPVPDIGAVAESISELRQLQTEFSNNSMIYKIVDSIVENLTAHPEKHYELIKPNECNFCSHLAKPLKRPMDVDQPKSIYNIWQILSFPTFKMRNCKEFPCDDVLENPVQMLVRLMMNILCSEDLIFPQFDPNALAQFFLRIAPHCTKNPVHTSHVLFTLSNFLRGQFKFWITSKLDIFTLIFCAFVLHLDVDSLVNSSFDNNENNNNNKKKNNDDGDDKNDDNGESDKLLVKNKKLDNKNENENENENLDGKNIENESKSLFNRNKSIIDRDFYDAFSDELSRKDIEIEIILKLLSEELSICGKGDEVFQYFSNLLRTLFLDVSFESKRASLFGATKARIQSSDFSVERDPLDCLLFMKDLLVLCDYCEYFSVKRELMLKALKVGDKERFSKKERKDKQFISAYHYNVASVVALPWVALFANFGALNEETNNIRTNIEYWKNKADENIP